MDVNFGRRQFLRVLGSSVAFIVFARLSVLEALGAPKGKAKTAAEIALPAGQIAVPADDAIASAIGYVSDATKVDHAKYSQYKAGQKCSKCALYTSSNEGWGKCQMIAAGLVKSGGWCGSFNAKS
jgi:hypothetical protein